MKTHPCLSLLTSLAVIGIAATVSAQSVLWSVNFPVPENYIFYTSASGQRPYLVSATDGMGGSVWIVTLATNNAEATPLWNRVLWLNNKGTPVLTRDMPYTTSSPFGPTVGPNAHVVRFSNKELAVQTTTPATDGGDSVTNILRRFTVKGSQITTTDTVLSSKEGVLGQSPAPDKYGFLSFDWQGSSDTGYTNLVIRRYSNK